MTYSIQTTTVTPEMARAWLETTPEHQRRITNSYVRRLAEDLTTGRFTSSPQPFIIDTNGDLLDGQHRSAAIVTSGVALESAIVVRGVEPDMFGRLDIGQRRTPAQFIESRQSSLIASGAKWCINYQLDDQLRDINNTQARMTIDQVIAEVERRPLLELLAGPVSLVSKATHISGPILLAIITLGSASAGDRVEDWLNGLNTGANLEVGDPRLTLRNQFISGYSLLNRNTGRRRSYAYILKSWNAFVNDEQLRMLKFRPHRPGGAMSGEIFPPIAGS